jgi:hypothetical protein
MKTPLVIVLVIVAGMLGFLTIYSQQSGGVAQTQGSPVVNEGTAAAVAGGHVAAAPAAAPETTPAAGGK